MPSTALPPEVFAAFNATGTPTLHDSGQGKIYRIDDIVLKPAALDPGYRYLAEIQRDITCEHFRIPKPVNCARATYPRRLRRWPRYHRSHRRHTRRFSANAQRGRGELRRIIELETLLALYWRDKIDEIVAQMSHIEIIYQRCH